jgi:hypothetical protein
LRYPSAYSGGGNGKTFYVFNTGQVTWTAPNYDAPGSAHGISLGWSTNTYDVDLRVVVYGDGSFSRTKLGGSAYQADTMVKPDWSAMNSPFVVDLYASGYNRDTYWDDFTVKRYSTDLSVSIGSETTRTSNQVIIGGVVAANVAYVDSTTLTAQTPAHAGGTVDVLVINGSDESDTLVSGFTYQSTPILNSFSVSPTTLAVGGDVTFSATWTDGGGSVKAHFCKTNAVTPSGTGGDCTGGAWASSLLDGSNPQLASFSTTGADEGVQTAYFFVCDDTSRCSPASTNTDTFEVVAPPSFSAFTLSPNNSAQGFAISGLTTSQDSSGRDVRVYLCKDSSGTPSGCGSAATTWCASAPGSSDPTCFFAAPSAGSYDAYAYVFNSIDMGALANPRVATLDVTNSNGAACISPTDCSSGNCIDGFCCESACTSPCAQCNIVGSEGACLPSGSGAAGAPSCAPYLCDGASISCPSSCGDGTECSTSFCVDGVCCDTACDGACQTCVAAGAFGTCQNKSAGSACSAPSCATGSQSYIDICDSSGTCLESGSRACAPYTCNAAATACLQACALDVDCTAGTHCDSGTCINDSSVACANDGECGSGFCVEGLCCDSACDGACESCTLAGQEGTCAPSPAGTGCGAASCLKETQTLAGACDGSRNCAPLGSVSCEPFTCDAGGALCLTNCISDDDCTIGTHCEMGACIKNDAVECGDTSDCSTGHCVDGYCCDSECDGPCSACNVIGKEGTCNPNPAGALGEDSCAPYTCDGVLTGCSAGCGTHAGCIDSHFCTPNGVCVLKRPNGEACDQGSQCLIRLCDGGTCGRELGNTCAASDECLSGICTEGVCCTDTCELENASCIVPGFEGTCSPTAGRTRAKSGGCATADPANGFSLLVLLVGLIRRRKLAWQKQ